MNAPSPCSASTTGSCSFSEKGLNERVVMVEFDSLDKAQAAHDSPEYKEALKVLGDAVERDFRIVEGVA